MLPLPQKQTKPKKTKPSTPARQDTDVMPGTVKIWHSLNPKRMPFNLCLFFIGLYPLFDYSSPLVPRMLAFCVCSSFIVRIYILALIERMRDEPFITISDESVIISPVFGYQHIFRFDELKSFGTHQEKVGWFLCVHYTSEKQHQRWSQSTFLGKANMAFLKNYYGTSYGGHNFFVDGIDMDAEKLCKLLNERLKIYRAEKA